jgi:hypothetical protein
MPFVYRVRSNEQNEARTTGGGSNFDSYIKSEYRIFQPSRGENCIRIMPASTHWDTTWYGLDVWVHYGVGPDRGSVICPWKGVPKIGRSGEPCPICHEHQKAKRAKDEQLTRDLRPVQRVVMFLLNRKDEGQNVLIWGMPYTLDQMIAKATRSRENGTFKQVDNPDSGHDIWFEKTGDGLTTKYSDVQLASAPTRVKQEYVNFVEENPIPECLVWRDFDEVKKIFEGMGGPGGGDDRDRGGDYRSGYQEPDYRDRGFRDNGNGYRERPPRDAYAQRPPRDDYAERPPRDDYAERPRAASEEREPPPRDDTTDRHEPPWQDNPERREPEPQPQPERQAEPPADDVTRVYRRPGSAAPQGNGADTSGPANAGQARADELRAQFLGGGRR